MVWVSCSFFGFIRHQRKFKREKPCRSKGHLPLMIDFYVVRQLSAHYLLHYFRSFMSSADRQPITCCISFGFITESTSR